MNFGIYVFQHIGSMRINGDYMLDAVVFKYLVHAAGMPGEYIVHTLIVKQSAPEYNSFPYK